VTTNLGLKAGRDIAYHTSRSGGATNAMAYYTDPAGEPPDQWAGKGAERLGLSGAVDAGQIRRLSVPGVILRRWKPITRPGLPAALSPRGR
jgi:hypothetical protein